jgi:hypothetical protein
MAENQARRLAEARALLDLLGSPPGQQRSVLALGAAAPDRTQTMIYGATGALFGAVFAGPIGILLVGGVTTTVGYLLDRIKAPPNPRGPWQPTVVLEEEAAAARADAARVALQPAATRAGGRKAEEPWKGFTREEVAHLRENIFGTAAWDALSPADMLKKHNLCNVCPICLEVFELEDGCIYMNASRQHTCTEKDTYHNTLFHSAYVKGKPPTWCACCNSLCTGHRHIAPVLASAPTILTGVVGAGLDATDMFGRRGGCDTGGNGGQGRIGKICRLNAMLVKAWELNARLRAGEFITEGIAKVEMVEALWAGAVHMAQTEDITYRMLAEKRFLLSEMDFPTQAEVAAMPVQRRRGNGPIFREPLDYPDWPRPEADRMFMPRLVLAEAGATNAAGQPPLEDDVPEKMVVFAHRKQDGQIMKHTKGLFLDTLTDYLVNHTEEATFTHKCPVGVLNSQHHCPEGTVCELECDADLHPVELLPLVALGHVRVDLYEKYRGLYNRYKYDAARGKGEALPTGPAAKNSPFVRRDQPPANNRHVSPVALPPVALPPVALPPMAPVVIQNVRNVDADSRARRESAVALFAAWKGSGRKQATDDDARRAIRTWFRAGQPRPATGSAAAFAEAAALPKSILMRLNRQSVPVNIGTDVQTETLLEAWRSKIYEAYDQNPRGFNNGNGEALLKVFKDGPAEYMRRMGPQGGGGLNACPMPSADPSPLPPNTACLTNIDTGEQKCYVINPKYFSLLRKLGTELFELQNDPTSQEEHLNKFIKQINAVLNTNNNTKRSRNKTGGKRKSRRSRR